MLPLLLLLSACRSKKEDTTIVCDRNQDPLCTVTLEPENTPDVFVNGEQLPVTQLTADDFSVIDGACPNGTSYDYPLPDGGTGAGYITDTRFNNPNFFPEIHFATQPILSCNDRWQLVQEDNTLAEVSFDDLEEYQGLLANQLGLSSVVYNSSFNWPPLFGTGSGLLATPFLSQQTGQAIFGIAEIDATANMVSAVQTWTIPQTKTEAPYINAYANGDVMQFWWLTDIDGTTGHADNVHVTLLNPSTKDTSALIPLLQDLSLEGQSTIEGIPFSELPAEEVMIGADGDVTTGGTQDDLWISQSPRVNFDSDLGIITQSGTSTLSRYDAGTGARGESYPLDLHVQSAASSFGYLASTLFEQRGLTRIVGTEFLLIMGLSNLFRNADDDFSGTVTAEVFDTTTGNVVSRQEFGLPQDCGFTDATCVFENAVFTSPDGQTIFAKGQTYSFDGQGYTASSVTVPQVEVGDYQYQWRESPDTTVHAYTAHSLYPNDYQSPEYEYGMQVLGIAPEQRIVVGEGGDFTMVDLALNQAYQVTFSEDPCYEYGWYDDFGRLYYLHPCFDQSADAFIDPDVVYVSGNPSIVQNGKMFLGYGDQVYVRNLE